MRKLELVEINLLGGRMNKKILVLLMGIFLIASVSALGVTPARTTIDFQPGLKQTVSFSIVNSENQDMELVIYAQGDLSESISLKENAITMSASEGSRQMSYEVSLPSELKPGLNIGEVVVLQLPGKSGSSEAYVGAALAVVSQLYVNVPFPGQYAEADLNVVNAEKDGEAVFIIPVVNRGKEHLSSVKANVDIYNKLNEKVGSFNTVEIEVASGQRGEIVHKWKAEVPVGRYRAVATLIYGTNPPKTINLEKQFNVGTSDLELQEISVNEFQLGDIAKFEMLVENKWSEQISGAYAQTQVYSDVGDVIADFNSAQYDISPLSKMVMVSYWDTAGVREGDYETKIFLRYGDKSSQKNVELKVSEDSIEVIGLGYVISSGKSGVAGNSNLVFILIIVIVVLVLINLLWFLVLRKRLKK